RSAVLILLRHWTWRRPAVARRHYLAMTRGASTRCSARNHAWRSLCLRFPQNVLIELRRFSCCEDVFGFGNFSGSPMGYEKILVHLDRGFVSQDAVFGYANAVKGGSQNAHAANHDRALQCGNDGGRHGPGDQERTDSRHPEESGTKQQAPQPAPQCAHPSPILQPISGIVI